LPVSLAGSALGRLECLLSHIHLGQPEKSQWVGIALQGTLKQTQNTKILSTKYCYMGCIVREAGEIGLHLDIWKRDDGLVFSRAWKPLIHPMKKWRKAPCEDSAQHYSLLQGHINPLCLFFLSPR
jgi:hypothetical protein